MQPFVSHLPPEPGGGQIKLDLVQSNLEALRTMVLDLNRAMDQVNLAITSVEKFLEEIDLALTARTPQPFRTVEESGTDEKGRDAIFRMEHRLACGRPHGGRFSIHIIITTLILYVGDDVRTEGWKPFSEARLAWPSCSREIRIEAARHLPELLVEIATVADDLTVRAHKTAKILSVPHSS